MDLEDLDKLLYKTPVIARGLHPVSLAYLTEEVSLYSSLSELNLELDEPVLRHSERIICLDPNVIHSTRFPVVKVEHDPFTPNLNSILFQQFDFIASNMLTHNQISQRIDSNSNKYRTIVLVLLDGLSFYDCKDWNSVEPCLAAHPTKTTIGFPSIIGNPSIASRLFMKGFQKRFGFTYWRTSQNKLTRDLFSTIKDTMTLDATRPNSFAQILMWLSSHDLTDTYIQVMHTALDEYVGGHRNSIPKEAVLHEIYNNLNSILEILKSKGLPSVLYAVADHGILWKDNDQPIECLNFPCGRYTRGFAGPGRGKHFAFDNQDYWVLDYPQMGRNWFGNEQGIHGGISFQESIVPFIRWEANCPC